MILRQIHLLVKKPSVRCSRTRYNEDVLYLISVTELELAEMSSTDSEDEETENGEGSSQGINTSHP